MRVINAVFIGIGLMLSVLIIQRQPAPPVRAADAPNQRFVPALQPEGTTDRAPSAKAFALDTKTGQLCRTYEIKGEPWERLLPTCMDLYKKF